MEEVVGLYGKTYHFWQVDRGDVVPMGAPELMISFTEEKQLKNGLEGLLEERDKKFGVDYKQKAEKRKDIKEPDVHGDADEAWKAGGGPVDGQTQG